MATATVTLGSIRLTQSEYDLLELMKQPGENRNAAIRRLIREAAGWKIVKEEKKTK